MNNNIHWNKTNKLLPSFDNSLEILNTGWVLGRFSMIKFSTVRYIESHKRWQMWDYSWCLEDPVEWMYIPTELVLEWGKR